MKIDVRRQPTGGGRQPVRRRWPWMPGAMVGAWLWIVGTWGVGAAVPIPQGETIGLPPAPPLPRSPVAVFRHLLALPPTERAQALAQRGEAQRAALLARLGEYERMSVEAREERLWATDLFWHVRQLLPRAAAERRELIAAAPEELRIVLTERLALWDALPAGDREMLIRNERAIRYFAHLREVVPPPLPGGAVDATRAPSQPRPTVEVPGLMHLSENERTRMVDAWRQFFDPSSGSGERRRQRTLRVMSEPERREMDAVLDRFRGLPAEQRRVCVESFARFATLSPEERQDFLRSAARWESLSPEERRTWRSLVTKLPPLPPVPSGVRFPPLPTPVDPSRGPNRANGG